MKIQYTYVEAHQKYNKTYAAQAHKLCLLGMDDNALAAFFGVDTGLLQQWIKDHKELAEGILKGRVLADGDVAMALFKRAVGYEAPDVDIRLVSGDVRQTPCIKYYPPDTSAIHLWLKNRQPQLWGDKKRTIAEEDTDEFRNVSEEDIDARIAALTKEAE